MTQLWNFAGGIHPPENKHQSTTRPIQQAGIPERLVLPLQQHIGEPAEVAVNVGDRVLKGQVVADVTSGMGVPVHAPTSGTIEDRKSTRLNSSHVRISYAVFCLKKKK